MNALLQDIDDRLARYRKLRKNPAMLKGRRENLEGSIEELEWVRAQIVAGDPSLTPPPPETIELDLI